MGQRGTARAAREQGNDSVLDSSVHSVTVPTLTLALALVAAPAWPQRKQIILLPSADSVLAPQERVLQTHPQKQASGRGP